MEGARGLNVEEFADKVGAPRRELEDARGATSPPQEGEKDGWVRMPLPRPRESALGRGGAKGRVFMKHQGRNELREGCVIGRIATARWLRWLEKDMKDAEGEKNPREEERGDKGEHHRAGFQRRQAKRGQKNWVHVVGKDTQEEGCNKDTTLNVLKLPGAQWDSEKGEELARDGTMEVSKLHRILRELNEGGDGRTDSLVGERRLLSDVLADRENVSVD